MQFLWWCAFDVGVGQTQPDPAAVHKRDDGAVVPMGKAVGTGVNSRLLYNEYPLMFVSIVYFCGCMVSLLYRV